MDPRAEGIGVERNGDRVDSARLASLVRRSPIATFTWWYWLVMCPIRTGVVYAVSQASGRTSGSAVGGSGAVVKPLGRWRSNGADAEDPCQRSLPVASVAFWPARTSHGRQGSFVKGGDGIPETTSALRRSDLEKQLSTADVRRKSLAPSQQDVHGRLIGVRQVVIYRFVQQFGAQPEAGVETPVRASQIPTWWTDRRKLISLSQALVRTCSTSIVPLLLGRPSVSGIGLNDGQRRRGTNQNSELLLPLEEDSPRCRVCAWRSLMWGQRLVEGCALALWRRWCRAGERHGRAEKCVNRTGVATSPDSRSIMFPRPAGACSESLSVVELGWHRLPAACCKRPAVVWLFARHVYRAAGGE